MRLKDYQPKDVQAPREAPTGFPNKPFISIQYSSKGTGKTTTLLNMIKEYDKHRFFQKIYLFSPSYDGDPKYKVLDGVHYQLHVYRTYTNDLFKEVIDEIRNDLHEWREYLRMKKVYEKAQRVRNHELLTDEEALDMYMCDWKPPVAPFEREPYSLVVFDDLASNKELMSQGKSLANSVALLSRHLLLSMAYVVQQYKNAVPKMVRLNCDWFILGRSKSLENMKSVSEELTSYASLQELVSMWEKATEQPYSYFTVNLMAPPALRFTRNFDEPVTA